MIRMYEWLCDDCGAVTEHTIDVSPEQLRDKDDVTYKTPPADGCGKCGSHNIKKLVASSVRVTYAQGSQKGKMNNQF